MDRRHAEELKKLKDDHDQLEARVRSSQDDKHSTHTIHEHTQGKSHLRQIINTQDDLSLSHLHHHEGWMTHRHPFVDCIMEVDLPLGWKPLNLERYDKTTNPDEHLDAFHTQANLNTNNDAIWCRVFPMSLKRVRRTPSKVHRQFRHPCWMFQLSVCNQLVTSHDFRCFSQSARSKWWISLKVHGHIWMNCCPDQES